MPDRRPPMRAVRMSEPTVEVRDGMRSWPEVALIWQLRSGERLSHQGCCYVGLTALKKLRRAIEEDPRLCEELGLKPDLKED